MTSEQPQESSRPVAIVTGASRRRGIGAAVCLALAGMGCDIFFTHWIPYDQMMEWGGEEDGPDYLQSQVRALGVRCEHVAVDLARVDAPQHLMQIVEERLGRAT